jgi:glycosyltransferase involved in cell wall biosynthesis
MAAPPVTVITATYNWPAALKVAMTTALQQSFADFEYLVIGDACTDETEDVVRAFDDPRIVWRNLPVNTGNQSGVNNVALAMARGELIAYLNHDDLWFPDHLTTLVRAIRSRDLDLVSSYCIEVSPPGEDYRTILGLPKRRPNGGVGFTPMTTCVLHTAAAARAVGGWTDWRRTARVPTWDFFERVVRLRGAVASAPEVTAAKFHSADRPGCYSRKTAEEQERYYARMRQDPQLRYREVLQAAISASLQKKPARPPVGLETGGRPGEQIERWRRIRGLPPMLELEEDAAMPPGRAG